MTADLATLHDQRNTEAAWVEARMEKLRHEKEEQLRSLTGDIAALRAERDELAAAAIAPQRVATQPEQLAVVAAAAAPTVADCSEGRLRAVMTRQNASPEELQDAIAGCEALLGEARRELAAKQLRRRRAAFEMLHRALDGGAGEEETLEQAVAEARYAGVEAEDIEKGEAKLAALRSLSEEERAHLALKKIGARKKELAFMYVKRDEDEALRLLLEQLEDGLRWLDWRDHSGRSLTRFAQEVRSLASQRLLAALSAPVTIASPAAIVSSPVALPATSPPRPSGAPPAVPQLCSPLRSPFGTDVGQKVEDLPEELAAAFEDGKVGVASPGTEETSTEFGEPDSGPSPPESAPRTPLSHSPCTSILGEAAESEAPLCDDDLAELRSKAFRATVQDDAELLASILEEVPMEVWTKWRNRADRGLLNLAEERGTSLAYGVLARALGIVREQVREAFSEQEAVWVLEKGEVQPRRATVMETAPSSSEAGVLLEFWDGDEPPMRVERCLVMKGHS